MVYIFQYSHTVTGIPTNSNSKAYHVMLELGRFLEYVRLSINSSKTFYEHSQLWLIANIVGILIAASLET